MKFYLFGALRTRLLIQLVLLAGFFVSISAVRADLITFQYEGELVEVSPELNQQFSIGDEFNGSYTFESDIPNTGSPGYYLFSSMAFSSGTYTASANKITWIQSPLSNGHTHIESYTLSVSGPPIINFVPHWMAIEWVSSRFNIPNGVSKTTYPGGPIIYPGFNPDLPPYEASPNQNYYSTDGILVYSPLEGLIGLPNQPLFYGSGYPALGNESRRFQFHFGNSNLGVSIIGDLKSVTVSNRISTMTIPENTWLQIGLKTTPPVGSTVADIIGDDISAPYGSEWVVYSYETNTNTYKQLSLTDTMLAGIGYWFIQTTGNPVTIDMPDESTDVNVRQSPACSSFEGCFEIPLQSSSSYEAQWQMIGYPFRDNGAIDKIRVVTAGIGSDCFTGCTLAQANEKYLVSEPLYHYDGTSYELLTTAGDKPFKPWDGAWIATLPSATGQNLTLLIPATN